MNAKITHEISVNTLPNVSMNLEDIVVIVPTAIRKILPMNLVVKVSVHKRKVVHRKHQKHPIVLHGHFD